MKTKILIIALANAMLTIGTMSYAQESKPSSAENKTSTVQTAPDPNLTASDSQDINQSMTETFQKDNGQTDSGNIHEQMTIQLQHFLEIRTKDDKVCLDNPKDCDYDVESVPNLVY